MFNELEKIKDEGNSIVMCRNVLPYLKNDYVQKIIETARDVLRDGSLFITGNYDRMIDIDIKLKDNGFYQPSVNHHNIFMRGDIGEMTKRLLSGYLI